LSNSAYTAGHHKDPPTRAMNQPSSPLDLEQPLEAEDFDTLDAILDDLRTRDDEVPQWEFCEGALAALLCTRRLILPDEFLPVLLGVETEDGTQTLDAAQWAPFMGMWTRRGYEVACALSA